MGLKFRGPQGLEAHNTRGLLGLDNQALWVIRH